MASSIGTQKLFANQLIQMWDHDAGDTSANPVTPDGGTTERWFDLRDFGGFAVVAMVSSLGGNGIIKLEIVANTQSDGNGTTVVIKDSGVVAAAAVGDWVVEECTAIEVEDVGNSEATPRALRWVAGRITMHHNDDEAVVTYVGVEPRFPRLDLTADTIA